MKISKVIFDIKPIPFHLIWWECQNYIIIKKYLVEKQSSFIFCVICFQNMDFTISDSKLLLCLRNLCEIKILCRFLKFYVIHLSRLSMFIYSWKQFNLIDLSEKDRSSYKWIKKKLWIKNLLSLQNLYN